MTEIAIRDMTRDDVEAIMPLMIQLGYEVNIAELMQRYETIMGADGHKLVAADSAGQISGFCHAFARPALEKPPEVIVQSLVVDSDMRQGGVGRALMEAVEAWAKSRGYASVALYSQVERGDAHAFYKSLGYERVATSGLLRKWLDREAG